MSDERSCDLKEKNGETDQQPRLLTLTSLYIHQPRLLNFFSWGSSPLRPGPAVAVAVYGHVVAVTVHRRHEVLKKMEVHPPFSVDEQRH